VGKDPASFFRLRRSRRTAHDRISLVELGWGSYLQVLIQTGFIRCEELRFECDRVLANAIVWSNARSHYLGVRSRINRVITTDDLVLFQY
jgi:hypothetical protein